LWTGQQLKNPNFGVSSHVPFESSHDDVKTYQILQVGDKIQLSPSLKLESRLGYANASLESKLQQGVQRQSGIELFKGIYSGTTPLQLIGTRDRIDFVAVLQHKADGPLRLWGRDFSAKNGLQVGVGWEELFSSNKYTAYDNLNLRFFNGMPYAIVMLNTPSKARQRVRHLSLFIQNNTLFSDLFALDIGLLLQSSVGWLAGGQETTRLQSALPAQNQPSSDDLIRWTTLSPRVGIVVPVSNRTAVRASYARYYHQLLATYLDFQNPAALRGKVFLWNDKNADRKFQLGEQGKLLSVFGGQYSKIDPDLKAPFTDEVTVGADFDFGGRVQLGITLLHRYEQRLVETTNIGVPPSAFSPVKIIDRGGDDKLGTFDDQEFIVYNQDSTTLGRDFYLLTNPAGFRDFYQGLEIDARSKDWVPGLYFHFSFAAFMIVGMASQEGEALEYDQGAIGNLFDTPNTLINADNRLFFDRAYLGKIAAAYQLPWDVQISGVAKYYDGLPFGRKLIVRGMNQGPFYILATPRGNRFPPSEKQGGHRVEFNLTLDVGIEKVVLFGEQRIGVRLDIFNLLNCNNNTRESDLSGPKFESRLPLEIQAPRVLRLGVKYEF
ncbi:MAG: TonB-dependent receptor, partial [Bacteroidota bacterium]